MLLTGQVIPVEIDNKESSDSVPAFEKSLQNENAMQRAKAAHEIMRSKEISMNTKAKLLLRALKNEHLTPQADTTNTMTGYLTTTEYLKTQYVLALKGLGKDVVPILKENYGKENGEMKEELVVLLGYLGDAEVYNEIVDVVRKTQNPYTKAKAIRALSGLGVGSNDLIILYIDALKDDFYVRVRSDKRRPPDLDFMNIYYPVREEAFSALRILGVQVERNKNEFYIKKDQGGNGRQTIKK